MISKERVFQKNIKEKQDSAKLIPVLWFYGLLHEDGVSVLHLSYGTSYGNISQEAARNNSLNGARMLFDQVLINEYTNTGSLTWTEFLLQGLREDKNYQDLYFVSDAKGATSLSVLLSSNSFATTAKEDARSLFKTIQYKENNPNRKEDATSLSLGKLSIPVLPGSEFVKDISLGYTSYDFFFDTPLANMGGIESFSFKKTEKETLKDVVGFMEDIQTARISSTVLAEDFNENKHGIPYYKLLFEDSSKTNSVVYIVMIESENEHENDYADLYIINLFVDKNNTKALDFLQKIIDNMTTIQ